MNGHDDAAGFPDGNNTNFAGVNNSGIPQIKDPTAPDNIAQKEIFSSPDLTISAENLPTEITTGASTPEVAAANTAANQSRIAAAFAQTDATAQQQNLANNMQIIPNSNLTQSSATGDIQLPKARKKSSKLPFILLGLVVVILAGVAIALQFISSNPKVSVADLLSENQETIAQVEEIYSSAFYGKLNVEQLFSVGVHDTLNTGLPKLINLSAELDKVDASKIKTSARESFTEIRTTLSQRAASYEATLALYNILHDALTNEDPAKLSALGELQERYKIVAENADGDETVDEDDGKNQTVEYLSERFANYLNDINTRHDLYVNYGCLTNSDSQECSEFFDQYIEVIVEFMQNTSIPYAVLSAYDKNSYGESFLVSDNIVEIIEGLK